MKLFTIIEDNNNQVKSLLIKEALIKKSREENLNINIDFCTNLSSLEIPISDNKDDILILITDNKLNEDELAIKSTKFGGKLIVLEHEAILKDIGLVFKNINKIPDLEVKNIVAVTACPTGIAHTFMAEDAILTNSKKLGINIRVETQGSVGVGNELSQAEIKNADLVIIAADREVDKNRFQGKKIYSSGTKVAINGGINFIKLAIEKAEKYQLANSNQERQTEKLRKTDGILSVYKHLMTGVSFMLPFVVAGGLLIALAFAIGGVNVTEAEGTFANTLLQIGGYALNSLMVPVLSAYIAFSIADRPALAPGMIGGLISVKIGAGFLGGIISGFLAGYIILYATKFINLPKNLKSLMPVLILPLIGVFITSLLMIYVIGKPVSELFEFLKLWLVGLQGGNAIFLGLILGGMMAVDMGGPINKAAYMFSVGLVGEGIYEPMAAVMLGGMVPPLALALATVIFAKKFTQEERDSKSSAFICGLAFVTESAIPFAARDPLRVIPSIVIGSATAGAIAMALSVGTRVPHGGLFLLPIPEAIINYFGYAIALLVGTVIGSICLSFKKNID